jgi:hypothetical protein
MKASCQTGNEGDLFGNDSILNLNLSGNIISLLKDRTEKATYHSITLTIIDGDNELGLPIKVKTRGNFRRKLGGCSFPPLMLNFSEKNPITNKSIFKNQDKIKLVVPCKGDKYVVREYMVYKLYNLLTPLSFKVRLVRVSFYDSLKKRSFSPVYGFILEDEHQMATRNNRGILKGKLVRPEQTQQADFLRSAVFEYLIGNTDWSVQYRQNIKLLVADESSSPITVPYDFDQSGIVNTSYAMPAAELQLSSVRERRYRGYCIKDISVFNEVFSEFNQIKDAIYKLYAESPLLEENYKKYTIKFIESFYETIQNEKLVIKAFTYPCRNDATTNVVIKGLN